MVNFSKDKFQDAGLDTTNTVHLDAFLYEADDEERFGTCIENNVQN